MTKKNKDTKLKFFPLYREEIAALSGMSDEDAGRIIKAACVYFLAIDDPKMRKFSEMWEHFENITSPSDVQLVTAFDGVRARIDTANETYRESIENGKAGANVRYGRRQEHTPVVEEKQPADPEADQPGNEEDRERQEFVRQCNEIMDRRGHNAIGGV